VGRTDITTQEPDIIIVVIITVCLRPILSPIYPNIKAPIGLSKYVEQNANAASKEAVKGSVLGKNSSLRRTAI
jgi:hypothetical protein